MLVRIMHPRTHGAPYSERDTKTRNKKYHLEGNAVPAGYCHAHLLLPVYASGVNYDVNSNFGTTLLPIFLLFGNFPPQHMARYKYLID